jgi:hypothetical protein
MKNTTLTLLGVLALSIISASAQIPTIDVSSLAQLYQQEQTLQNQLSTAKSTLGQVTSIYNQDVQTYNTALGNITQLGNMQNWISSFTGLQTQANQNLNPFASTPAAPVQNFNNNVAYWSQGSGNGQAGSQWTTSMNHVNNNTATAAQQNMALGGYNAKLQQNAADSAVFSSNLVQQAQQVVSDAQNGTLIQQAGAQNALLLQQTAMLDRMKNDINNETVAEAAQREHDLKAAHDQQLILSVTLNIPQ